MATSADFVEILEAALDDGPVDDLTRLSGGASRETWRFRVGNRPLVVQRQRAGDERDMLVEASVIDAASRAGVPVPTLVAAERSADGSAFMIVDAIDGETIARKIQRDDEYVRARTRFASQCGAALAAVHTIEPVDGLEPVDPITYYTELMDELVDAGTAAPQPVLELVRRWLIDHRPDPVEPVVVHGDFRLGNLIIDEQGLAAVIDWELAHLGDPMEDLGWLCVKAWRFGQQPRVAGLGESDALFASYERASGTEIDADRVRWWEVLGTWKWAVMCMLQASAHLGGAARSHELAAIGRRVCENEHDLFLALEGAW
jgi:aminoglycoside phosphotransferase (APT) family kinase protein